jgi:predicted dehydrogenase
VEVEIPDYLEVLAEMSQGALARFQMSDVTGLSRANRATLYGTEGTLRFEDGELYLGKDGDEDLARLEIPESERGKWRVERDFIDAIRGRAEVELTDFATGVQYMEFTDAIWLSMEQGRLVGLPLTPSTANTFEQQEGN